MGRNHAKVPSVYVSKIELNDTGKDQGRMKRKYTAWVTETRTWPAVIALGLLLSIVVVPGGLWLRMALGLPVADARLRLAVSAQDVEEMRAAFAEGASLPVKAEDASAMMMLAAEDPPEILRELLSRGGDPNAREPGGRTPLYNAAETGHSQNVHLLLGAGAKPDSMRANQSTPLIVAIQRGHTQTAAVLLEHGALFDAALPGCSRRVLVEAAQSNLCEPALLEMLIAAGADVNAADGRGITPLQAAAQSGRADLAALLIRHGAGPMFSRGGDEVAETVSHQ